MEELQVFEQRSVLGQELKIYGTQEEPLFLAKDIATWIGHSNRTMMVNNVDEDEKVVRNAYTLGGMQEQWFLTEDGMYEVLMQSRKPIAKAFKKKVKEILKDIRKHGMYATEQTIDSMLNDPDTAIQLLQNYKEEKNRRAIAELKVKELEPKAAYYDLILSNTSLITIGSIAKDYGMTAQAMNKLLHGLKVQYKQSNQWLLYAKYQAEGYVSSDPAVITHTDGTTSVRMSTKWTQKGRKFLYKLLKEHDILPVIEQEVS